MADHSSTPLNQPLPRMTDSMAHQAGPGPSSLKLAALSANSYHLDSPPFTGTAGPLGEYSDDYSRQSSSSIREDSSYAAREEVLLSSGEQTPGNILGSRLASQRERTSTGDSSNITRYSSQDHQSRQSQVMHKGLQEREEAYVRDYRPTNEDVPRWDLDDIQRQREDPSGSGIPTAHPNHSLSPPPFSSSGQGPLAPSTSTLRQGTPTMPQSPFTEARKPRVRESSRPSFTQISNSNSTSNEDAGSGVADGDADADESIHEEEVDGDETAYLTRPVLGLNGTAKVVPTQSQTKEEYKFPRHRLPTQMRNESKIPLVIVACGSFSPPTYLHLRIFEMAKDQVLESGKYELLGGYYSPVSDYYKKEGLAKATHRVRMCELAVEKTSTWLMVDAWESLQDEYQRTAVVLDHFDEEVNGGVEGGVMISDGSRRKIRIMLLAGGDLIQSMGEPGVWADADLHHILGRYGCMIVERTGADVWSFLLSHDLLWRYRRNLKVVKQTIFNDISSSKVRLFVRRGQSIKYLLPNSVIHYIEQHQLYRLPKELDTEPSDADTQHL